MKAKKIVQNFYKKDVFLNKEIVDAFLHPEITIDWHTSKGFVLMDREKILDLADQLKNSFQSSRMHITHLLEDNKKITVRYIHYVNTIENPKEEMILGVFMVIWELKKGKLYHGYQMSQLD